MGSAPQSLHTILDSFFLFRLKNYLLFPGFWYCPENIGDVYIHDIVLIWKEDAGVKHVQRFKGGQKKRSSNRTLKEQVYTSGETNIV